MPTKVLVREVHAYKCSICRAEFDDFEVASSCESRLAKEQHSFKIEDRVYPLNPPISDLIGHFKIDEEMVIVGLEWQKQTHKPVYIVAIKHDPTLFFPPLEVLAEQTYMRGSCPR